MALARLMALAGLVALGPGVARARAQVPTLPRVDSLITAGDYDQARAALDRWWSARQEFDVPGSDRARALLLRARLAPDMEAAEPDYLAIVLGYPTSEHAPEALLRLGQGLLAAGEPARAEGYLRRLVADYPGRPQHTPGLLWLARASSAARHPTAACAAARNGLRDADDADMEALLRIEESAACAAGGVAEAEPARPAARPAPPAARSPDPAPPAQGRPAQDRPAQDRPAGPAATTGRFAAQAGAFRNPEGARDLVEKLRASGFDARTVLLPGSPLLRVRVGRLTSADEAARVVARLKGRGFDAYPVADVREERQP